MFVLLTVQYTTELKDKLSLPKQITRHTNFCNLDTCFYMTVSFIVLKSLGKKSDRDPGFKKNKFS